MSTKTKLGLRVSHTSDKTLAALAYVTHQNRSALVERAVAEMLDRMPAAQRDAVQTALAVAGEVESG